MPTGGSVKLLRLLRLARLGKLVKKARSVVSGRIWEEYGEEGVGRMVCALLRSACDWLLNDVILTTLVQPLLLIDPATPNDFDGIRWWYQVYRIHYAAALPGEIRDA